MTDLLLKIHKLLAVENHLGKLIQWENQMICLEFNLLMLSKNYFNLNSNKKKEEQVSWKDYNKEIKARIQTCNQK